MLVGCVAKKYLMGLCLSDLIYKRPLHGLPTCDIYSVIPQDRIMAVPCSEEGHETCTRHRKHDSGTPAATSSGLAMTGSANSLQ